MDYPGREMMTESTCAEDSGDGYITAKLIGLVQPKILIKKTFCRTHAHVVPILLFFFHGTYNEF